MVRLALEENMQVEDNETELEAVSPEERALSVVEVTTMLAEGRSVPLPQRRADWVPASAKWKCNSVHKKRGWKYYVYKTNPNLRLKVCAGKPTMYYMNAARHQTALTMWKSRTDAQATLKRMSLLFICHASASNGCLEPVVPALRDKTEGAE